MAHMVAALEDPMGAPLRVGRFGWKSQVATVLTFSADAALNEMGLTNRFLMDDNDPNGIDPPVLMDCDTVLDPEDTPDGQGFDFVDRVTHFQRFLAQPPQTPRSGMTGEGTFDSIGCADCHHTQFTTADDPSLEDALRDQTIQPYSDFLLHNMGTLGDGIVQGDVRSATHLELAAKAVVVGNVYYNLIEMVMGSEVNGNLMHIGPNQSEAKRLGTDKILPLDKESLPESQ